MTLSPATTYTGLDPANNQPEEQTVVEVFGGFVIAHGADGREEVWLRKAFEMWAGMRVAR